MSPPLKSPMTLRTRYAAMAAWLLVASAIAGCEGGRERPPSVAVRVLHAAPARDTLDFLRVQRNETQLEFRQTSGPLVFDADEYDFNVRTPAPGGNSTVLLGGFSRQLVPERDYLFAITEANGQLTPIVVEKERFSGPSSQVTAVHAAPSLGRVSVYVEPDGIAPSSVAPVGTVGFGESSEPLTREAGNYRLSLTEAGNPDNVLMTSGVVALQEGVPYIFAIIDPSADSIAPITVAFIGPESTLLFDQNVQSSLTVINAATDGAARDVFLDDDFDTPLAAVPPLARVADLPVAAGDRDLTVTPAGSTGVIEAELTSTYARSRRHIALIGGDTGELEVAFGFDERRPITGHARIMFMNAATGIDRIEYFLVEPGTDISNLVSTIVLPAPRMTARLSFPPGDYDLIARELEGEVVGGPTPVTIDAGGVYSVLTINGEVGGTVDFVYFEDFVE